jgi:hypothetical protein
MDPDTRSPFFMTTVSATRRAARNGSGARERKIAILIILDSSDQGGL